MDEQTEFVNCPFYYRGEKNKYRITCAEICFGVTVSLVFLGSKRRYFEKICSNDFKKCLVYNMLEQNEAEKRFRIGRDEAEMKPRKKAANTTKCTSNFRPFWFEVESKRGVKNK